MTSPLAHGFYPTATLAAKFAHDVPVRYLRERQRCWHGREHALTMLRDITALDVSGDDRHSLQLAAVYHDAIYNPRAADNEEQSAALLAQHAADSNAPVVRRALELIADSKWTCLPDTALGRSFFHLDTFQLSDGCPLAERLAYERAIFREY